MNWKGHGRNWSWLNLRYYPGTCLEKKRHKYLSQDSLFSDRDLNPGPPEYEEVLTIWSLRSVTCTLNQTFISYLCIYLVVCIIQ
jgi:hypothetical protein